MDKLPLLFYGAALTYVLLVGAQRAGWRGLRVLALAATAFCLLSWGVALLQPQGGATPSWGEGMVRSFYLTREALDLLGSGAAAGLFLGLALLASLAAAFELRSLARR